MAFGAIKHKTRGRKAIRAYHHERGDKTIKATIKIRRVSYNLRSVHYSAKACLFTGWKVGEDHRRNDGRVVGLYARRRRLSDRCAEGRGNSPTVAVKRALAALSKKSL